MEKKYEFVDETKTLDDGTVLHRIKALRSFGDVKAGDLGGFIEKEKNLSHLGDCWIYDNAKVYGNAKVFDNASIRNDAKIYDNARVSGNAYVGYNAIICDNAYVYGDTYVWGNARVYDHASVHDNARVYDHARVYGSAKVFGNAYVYSDANVSGNTCVYSGAIICDNANISKTSDYMVIGPIGSRNDYTTFYKTDNNTIYVKCGCFNASIDEFETRVREVHGNNKHAINYNKAIDLAKTMINNE